MLNNGTLQLFFIPPLLLIILPWLAIINHYSSRQPGQASYNPLNHNKTQ